MKNKKNKKIIIFASSEGTNAEEIIKYFKNKEGISVELVITNNNNAGVLKRAKKHSIPSISYNNEAFEKKLVFEILNLLSPDLIVLAGFLRKIPNIIISKFPNKIINIHPALLPKHGGKGMYGEAVHKSVIKSCDSETGITIHFINRNYDEGEIIFQKSLKVEAKDSPKSLFRRVQKLEHKYYPLIIEKLLNE
ncbi:MAG: phosphoribosylglycinamide formyltransferase [Bacteroidota bacterium]|nr:phosphoribosylglycinamide formyltransferase [Bacteroidota bacterium]